MANYREPTKRRRVEVPVPSGRSARQRRVPQRPHPREVDDTNRAPIDAGIVVVTTLLTTVLLLAISGQLRDTTSANLIAQSPAPPAGGFMTVQPTPQPSFMTPTPRAEPTRSEAMPSPES